MKGWSRRRKMLIWIPVIVAVVGLLILLRIHNEVARAGKGRIYEPGDSDIPKKKVALVLGARVFEGGRLSTVLADRVDAAIALYNDGVVEKLLMSGDNRTQKYNEVTAMRNYAIDRGVPSDDVVRDFAGFRTYDSVYRAKEVWDLDELIIVSQRFHLPRALYIAEKLDMDAVGVMAADNAYRSVKRASRREIAARLFAWVDVLVGRDPYFLGPKEGLSGDAQVTRVKE